MKNLHKILFGALIFANGAFFQFQALQKLQQRLKPVQQTATHLHGI